MAREFDRKIVTADGEEYFGFGFGADAARVCELVFNTSMIGYQEIVSDPSNAYQMVVMTYPLIGNYGTSDDDFEAKVPGIGALVVREYNDAPSNFRYTKTLSEVLLENDIPAIEGADTRKLTRSIRDKGSRKAYICPADTPTDAALRILAETELPADEVQRVSCKKRWYSRTSKARYNVVAVDFGMRLSLVRSLNALRCNVTVVPFDTPAETILAMAPDGVFLSNGPGNPEDVKPGIELIKTLRGKLPIFGVCLGMQLICLSYGAKTSKLKFGHRGANHPVRRTDTGGVEIVSQNHGYAADEASLAGTGLEVTHVNVLDGTVEGVECARDRIFGVQFHPDSAVGQPGGSYLFDRFIAMMEEGKTNA